MNLGELIHQVENERPSWSRSCPDERDPDPIDPKTIDYTFSLIPGLSNENIEAMEQTGASVQDPEGRLRAHPLGAGWIEYQYGFEGKDCFTWSRYWRDLPVQLLQEVFTFEEIVRLWKSDVIMSEAGNWIDKKHPFLRKIAYGHWHYGSTSNWNLLVRHLEGFKRISIDLPDFEVRIIHTRTINQCAWAWQIRDVYLDASFGVALYYKGQHVLTWGFVPCCYGVLVAQAQLRQKRGNRFLYKLPRHYLDIGLEILARAFPDEPIWLIKGGSSVEATRHNYGSLPCPIVGEVEERIVALYNRPLDVYRRGTKTMRQDGRIFVRLIAKIVSERAA